MEFILLDGFSVSLQDFSVPKIPLEEAQESIEKQSSALEQSRRLSGPFVEMRVDNNLKDVKQQISGFVVKSSQLGLFIDQIGRAHVWTPVTPENLVCRLLLEKKKFF